MTIPGTAAVLGLGLIGGSVARALARNGVEVLGFDEDAKSAEAALQSGAVASVLDKSLRGLENAEWVIIAVPVDSAVQLLKTISNRAHTAKLITDTGSTKRRIVSEAARLGIGPRFVGSHPMAGSHKSGWGASRADLFEGATAYICTDSSAPENTASASALEAAKNLWTLLGARTERITAERHDEKVAATSHLPHLLSTTLAVTLDDLGITIGELGPGGREVTRLAAGDESLWQAILLDNADEVVQATDAFLAKLKGFRAALAERDTQAMKGYLSHGRAWTAGKFS